MPLTAKEKEDLYLTIYSIVRAIPFGRVTTYGAIAKVIGVAGGARIVGYALNNCHQVLPVVPAHRVVNRVGLLSGKHHFGSPTAMQEALEKEGIKVEDDIVQGFDTLFWDPMTEM